MKRPPLRRQRAPQVMQELPTLRPLTFAPLPYQTHPIDTYDGPQGWGPFYGPWTPWDFHDPAAEIAFTYGHGESNDPGFGVPYDVLTLFGDDSLDLVFNTSYDIEAQRENDESQRSYNSTASNAVAQPRDQSILSQLRSVLRGGE